MPNMCVPCTRPTSWVDVNSVSLCRTYEMQKIANEIQMTRLLRVLWVAMHVHVLSFLSVWFPLSKKTMHKCKDLDTWRRATTNT